MSFLPFPEQKYTELYYVNSINNTKIAKQSSQFKHTVREKLLVSIFYCDEKWNHLSARMRIMPTKKVIFFLTPSENLEKMLEHYYFRDYSKQTF